VNYSALGEISGQPVKIRGLQDAPQQPSFAGPAAMTLQGSVEAFD
jgi:hypothetical protein